MSLVGSLQTELKNLVSQSRRRNNELAASSEVSLEKLETLLATSPDNLVERLRADPSFITPFILACSGANAKSCASALQSIHSLAGYGGIAPSRLAELLRALMDATQLGLGIQLKILQLLPVLLQQYVGELDEDLAVDLLQVCAELLANNKVAMVHNAAYATLQQLITGLFDRVATAKDETPTKHLVVDQDHTFEVSSARYVAAMVLLDLCEMAEHNPPKLVKFDALPLTFTLELLELTLTNQATVMHKYPEFGAILRLRITPLLLRLFSEATEFPVLLRVTRVFYLLLRQHLDLVTTEAEVILSILTQVASHGPAWKRALCVEVLQGIFLETSLVLQIYNRYDAVEGRMKVLQSIIADFADSLTQNNGALALAASASDHFPDRDDESSSSHQSAGISRDTMQRVPVIDLLDKVEAPKVSLDYLYYLILKCVSSLADGIHVLARKQESRDAAVGLLQSLSTPLLKCFTILLGAAMDLQLFQLVVRSVQRVAHAAGILGESSYRDEFTKLLQQFSHLPEDADVRSLLLPRVALCTKALFNLGYALGNQLGDSWYIITEVIGQISDQTGAQASLDIRFGEEPAYQQIEMALRKLLDGTQNLNDDAIVAFMRALDRTGSSMCLVLIEYIATTNILRFIDPESPCWEAFNSIVLKHVLDQDSHRLLASRVLNEIAQVALENATYADPEAQEERPLSLDEKKRSHIMIIESVCSQMVATGYDVQVAAIRTLNELLDKCGARLLAGWEQIFKVLSDITESKPGPASEDRTMLIKSSFHTLELICSDFLDNLPYSCMFELTLCLEKYSRQDVDLNTSFSSTSLFWAVCDHLIKGENVGSDFATPVYTEEDLVKLARDETSPVKRYALWMLALIRLADIASAPHQQVRTGAIQIFLRLFDTHGLKLPLGAWAVAHRLAFPTLIKVGLEKSDDCTDTERDETLCLIVSGLDKIYVANWRKFSRLPDFNKYWTEFVTYLDRVDRVSAIVAMNAYATVAHILKEGGPEIPREPLWQFWIKQDPAPSYSRRSPKKTADSLEELVGLLPLIGVENPGTAMNLVTRCARFQFYHSSGPRSTEMSVLQKACVKQLEKLKLETPELLSEYLTSLTDLALLPHIAAEDTDEEDGWLGPDMYRGMSQWALETIDSLLEKRRSQFNDSNVLRALPKMLDAMVTITQSESQRATAMHTYLTLLEILKGLDADKIPSDATTSVVAGSKSILAATTSGDNEQQTIDAIDKYVGLIDDLPAINSDEWQAVLKTILVYSVVYERHQLTREFYASEAFDTEDLTYLTYGTVEPPLAFPETRVAYFCLHLLKRLADAKKSYSAIAKHFFDARTRVVLMQYVGDSSISGREPLRTVLREELLFVLRQLEQQPVSPEIAALVVDVIPRADREVLGLAKSILAK